MGEDTFIGFNVTTAPTVAPTTENGTHIHNGFLVIPSYVLMIKLASCLLSLFGGAMIFATFFKIQTARNFIRKLLLYLTVANMAEAVGSFAGVIRYWIISSNSNRRLGEQPTDSLCFLQAVVVNFGAPAGFLWTSVIAIYFYMGLHRPQYEKPLSSSKAEVLYHFICWGIPGVTLVCAVVLDVLGEDQNIYGDSGCWIRSDMARWKVILWMFVSIKGWELVSILIVLLVVVYIFFRRHVHHCVRGGYLDLDQQPENANDTEDARSRSRDRSFIYIWFVLYIVRLAGHVRFFLALPSSKMVVSETVESVLMALQAFGDSSQAFFNFIVICLCEGHIRRRMCRWFCCCCRNTEALDNSYSVNT